MLHLAQQTLQNKQAPNIQRVCNILQPHLDVSLFLYIPFQMASNFPAHFNKEVLAVLEVLADKKEMMLEGRVQ